MKIEFPGDLFPYRREGITPLSVFNTVHNAMSSPVFKLEAVSSRFFGMIGILGSASIP